MSSENETLRWPTNLDREGILQRLARVREAARENGHPEVAGLLDGIEGHSGAQIGQAVIAAINLVQEDPAHATLASQLAMVAMNLKNLK